MVRFQAILAAAVLIAASTHVIALHMLAEVPPGSASGAYPRLDFKREFAALFLDQAARKPSCHAAQMVATGKPEAIANAPFES